MYLQLQSRALGFDLGNCTVCTYLQKHLPCLFLKPAELEGKVLVFLGSPEKHLFIPLPSVGLNNRPLSSYNILQHSHLSEPGSCIRWRGCWAGGSASLWMISETRGKALSYLKWMASSPFGHDLRCKRTKMTVRFLKYVPIPSSSSFWFCVGCEQKLGAWREKGVSEAVSGQSEKNGRRGGSWWGGRWNRGRVLLRWSSVCWYVGKCRMGDLEANEMSLESSLMLVLCNT